MLQLLHGGETPVLAALLCGNKKNLPSSSAIAHELKPSPFLLPLPFCFCLCVDNVTKIQEGRATITNDKEDDGFMLLLRKTFACAFIKRVRGGGGVDSFFLACLSSHI